jgi:hypothetical protein
VIDVGAIRKEHIGNSSGNQVEDRNDSCKYRRWTWLAMRDSVWGRGQGQNQGKVALMFQFVSHSVQQLRHAKGLMNGPPCPEEFRDIQDILFPSYA